MLNKIIAMDIENFFRYVKSIQYGYKDRFGKLHLANDGNFTVQDYSFSSPEEIIKNNCCWCWDLAEFIKLYCAKHGYTCRSYFMEYLSDNLHQTHTQVFLHYQGKWSAAPDNYLELQFGNPNFDELESCVKWFINLFTDYLKSVLKENYEETHLFVKEYTCTFQVDTRDVFGDGGDNLSNCQPQCRYVGQVTDMRRGVVYVRLNNGVNAIAHTCYDARMPGRKDTVSFAVTRLDEAHGIAIGIITRIIKQNL